MPARQSTLTGATWRRSSRCVGESHCVEVADLGVAVGLRNSRKPGVTLTLAKADWDSLLDGIIAGELR